MDTSTHIAMGIGLAGLAHLDPAVANQPGMTESILMATIIGSNAPDFDAIYRLKGNAAYYRRHRGASHSLPALPFWCFFVSAFAFLFNPAADYLHLLLWTSVAVVLHVAVDVFNVYGTKALYPFDKRWLAYNTIHIFDPFIMALHLAGVALWLAGLHPGYVFASMYALLLAYYFWRWKYAKMVKRKVEREVSVSGTCTVVPTLFWWRWDFIIETEQAYHVGEINRNDIVVRKTLQKKKRHHPLIHKSKKDPCVRDFLHSCKMPYATLDSTSFGYEVRWFDLRFRSGDKFPYMTVVYMDADGKVIDSYMGWVFEEKKLSKKLSQPEAV